MKPAIAPSTDVTANRPTPPSFADAPNDASFRSVSPQPSTASSGREETKAEIDAGRSAPFADGADSLRRAASGASAQSASSASPGSAAGSAPATGGDPSVGRSDPPGALLSSGSFLGADLAASGSPSSSGLVVVSSATPTATGQTVAPETTTQQPATGALRAAAGAAAAGFVSSSLAYGVVGNSVETLAATGLKRAGVADTTATYVGALIGGAAAGVSLKVAGMIGREVGSAIGRNQFTEPLTTGAAEKKWTDFLPPINKVLPDAAGFAAGFAMFNGIDAEARQVLTGGSELGKLAFKAARSGTGGAFAAMLRDGVQALRTIPEGSQLSASRMPPRDEQAWSNLAKEIKAVIKTPILAKPKDSPTRGTAANTVAAAAGYIAFTAVASKMEAEFRMKLAPPVTPGVAPPVTQTVAPQAAPTASASPTPPPTTQPTTAAPTPPPTTQPTTAAPTPSPTPKPTTAAPTQGSTAQPSAATPSGIGDRALQLAGRYEDHGGFNAAAIVSGVVAFVVVEHLVAHALNEISDRIQDASRERQGLDATYRDENRDLPTTAADAPSDPPAAIPRHAPSPPSSNDSSDDAAFSSIADESGISAFTEASAALGAPPLSRTAPGPIPDDLPSLPSSGASSDGADAKRA